MVTRTARLLFRSGRVDAGARKVSRSLEIQVCPSGSDDIVWTTKEYCARIWHGFAISD